MVMIIGRCSSNLPDDDSASLRSQHQYPCTAAIISRKGQAVDPLRKGHRRFLMISFSGVDVYNGLLGLSSKDMTGAHGQAINTSITLLERRSDGWRRPKFLKIDAAAAGFLMPLIPF